MLNSDSEHLLDLKAEFQTILKTDDNKSIMQELQLQQVTMDEEQVSQMIDNIQNQSKKNYDASPM